MTTAPEAADTLRRLGAICEAVAAETGCDAARVRKRGRGGMLRETRIALFIGRDLFDFAPAAMARALGMQRVDVLRAVRFTEHQRSNDAAFAATVEAVKARLGQVHRLASR